MINPHTLSEEAIFSTVRIVGERNGIPGAGTAFFYGHPTPANRKVSIWLVTNKHVIENISNTMIRFHRSNGGLPDGQTINIRMDAYRENGIGHPDASVDLAALNVGECLKEYFLKQEIFFRPIGRNIFPSQQQLESLSAIEDITMIGYPTGLMDEYNNLPLTRRGITASHPSLDFKGRAEGVVDIGAFRGSSGSPIFILNEGSYSTKQYAVVAGNRIIFLGVQCRGVMQNMRGELVQVAGQNSASTQTNTQMFAHLAYYIKAQELANFMDNIN